MNVKQVSSIFNSLAQQTLGIKGLTATDASAVTIGKALMTSDDVDTFYKTLNDVIGRTIFENRPYMRTLDLWREPFEYGAMLRSLYVDRGEATDNEAWSDVSTNYDAFKPNQTQIVQQTLWNTVAVWDYDYTVPDYQVNSAFNSWESVAALFDALFVASENDLNMSMENSERLTRSSMIARCVKSGHVIDLGAAYTSATGKGITFKDSFYDADFLRFCAQIIPVICDKFERVSTLYNISGHTTFTPKSSQRLTLLSNFGRAFDVYLQSGTFHENITSLGKYTLAPYWQSEGTSMVPSLTDVSGVNLTGITIPKDNNTYTVSASNIIGILYDEMAMGITMDERKSDALHNPKKDFTNYFHKAKRGLYNNMGYNAVVFVVNDSAAPTPTPTTGE